MCMRERRSGKTEKEKKVRRRKKVKWIHVINVGVLWLGGQFRREKMGTVSGVKRTCVEVW